MSQTALIPTSSSATTRSGGAGLEATADVWARLTSARGELLAAIIAGGLLLLGFVLRQVDADPASLTHTLGHACSWVSLAIGLFHGGRAAFAALAQRTFDIDVLMVVGAVLAAAMGAPNEGALLLFLFVLSGALEDLAMQRTTRAVEALHKLMPTRALRLRTGTNAEAQDPADPASWEEVAPEALVAGDVVKILPGESIPTDARVTDVGGEAGDEGSVNQASLTGESMPRTVVAGDEVYAGTVNVGNPMRARVTRPASQSSLQRILNLVIEAQQQREPMQRLIDRFSQPYAISVMVVSVLVFLIWWLGLGAPIWTESAGAAARGADTSGVNGEVGAPEAGALYVAITLLIVASPCAIIIATPTATLAAIARAARAGVLFKGGQSIERLAHLRAVCFDKTGTLTVGKPRVKAVYPVGWSDEVSLLAAAAGLEAESTHPIATAIMQAASARGIAPVQGHQHAFTAGRGVSAMLPGPDNTPKPARLGTLIFTRDLIPVCLRQRVQDVLESVQEQGQIGVVIAHDEQAAVIVLADTVRPGAPTLVRELHALGVRPVVMLTGDNERTAHAVAKQLGLDAFFAQLLPQDKVEWVKRIKAGTWQNDAGMSADIGDTSSARTHTSSLAPDRTLSSAPALADARVGPPTVRTDPVFTGVIGDGVNDAPALTAADVAIAIGSIGSDAALESADIVLLSDDLGEVPWAVRLARRARRTIAINFTLALSALVLMAIWTLVGSRVGSPVPLWVGVLGHEGGTLLVVLNSLLLLAHPSPAGGVGVLRRDAAVVERTTERKNEPDSVVQ